ncbi:MAG: CRISPR-associated endonuclease Cas2 [Acidobacteriia bacterium]|nr:CRISPR-associated endonuclease Cas2 [Terriglobia bacterium]MYD53216.1 CRISPR-associated endonuclease Cas2 [Chloroflexota bacterium]
MEILVVYDVATEDARGRRRLRRVAQCCQAYGQRVQKSVFECVINEADLERLIARLRAEMDEASDSVRIYRLREPLSTHLLTLGARPSFDQRDPLVF